MEMEEEIKILKLNQNSQNNQINQTNNNFLLIILQIPIQLI